MHSNDLCLSKIWIKRISFLYLLIPFLIFCLGYLKIYISLGITLIFLWLIIKNWPSIAQAGQTFSISRRSLFITFIIVLLWVVLSGIGGVAFQNPDLHARNAIFHDLINYNWPVKYNTYPTDSSITYTLTYYIGFWLPAALVGKIAGWQAANIALYIWSVLGIMLAILLLSTRIKLSPIIITLLLVFFSGMDGLGVFLRMLALPSNNILPTLWPPIQQLEWWAPGFQYSSFTTLLFWVFNQAIPVWLCMALLITAEDRKYLLVIWSICCFFAPFPALGMFPYVILKMAKRLFNPENIRETLEIRLKDTLLMRGLSDLRSQLTAENIIGGGFILLITFFYFSTNIHASEEAVNNLPLNNWILYPFFLILEGLLLWFLFKANNKWNLNWYLSGALFLVIPFIKIGSGQDFCLRASIPTLFMLMLWSAEMLSSPRSQTRTFLVILLCIGAITPIYEINRSIYRTAKYYLDPPSEIQVLEGQQVNLYPQETIENDHPYTLVADSFKTLAVFNPETINNFLAKADHTFFETYLEK